jgi:hypothetical protein
MITSQEASSLAGATFGEGKQDTTPGGGKMCTYGAGTANVFTVEVAQAPDVASAKKDVDEFKADLEANLAQLTSEGLTITQLPDLADGGILATAHVELAGTYFEGIAIGFVKGTTFFGFSDILRGQKAPSEEAVRAEAEKVLAQLP